MTTGPAIDLRARQVGWLWREPGRPWAFRESLDGRTYPVDAEFREVYVKADSAAWTYSPIGRVAAPSAGPDHELLPGEDASDLLERHEPWRPRWPWRWARGRPEPRR